MQPQHAAMAQHDTAATAAAVLTPRRWFVYLLSIALSCKVALSAVCCDVLSGECEDWIMYANVSCAVLCCALCISVQALSTHLLLLRTVHHFAGV